jgi:V8-like Glu-specific endopeptidase
MNPSLRARLILENEVDRIDHAVVGPRDSRVQEVETRRFPWSTICHLCRDFGEGTCAGCSGTLIAPNLVMTAAHCLFSLARRRAPARIEVMPGRVDRETRPFGSISSRQFFVPRAFIDGPDRLIWDFGVIVLPRPFRHARAFMPLSAASDPELARIAVQHRLTVAGYPSDRPIGTLWRHSERLMKVTPRRLFYSVDTCPGHSGSAVWVDRGRGPEIVAVHTMGILDAEGRSYGCTRGSVLAPPGMLNSGVRLTREVIDAVLRPSRARAGPWRMVPLSDA